MEVFVGRFSRDLKILFELSKLELQRFELARVDCLMYET